ncbi:MAG: hypothetical protein Q8Q62_03975 [Mesorhizobium sp.]|nr:hypothetical protein [Mesorhizobium sp.]
MRAVKAGAVYVALVFAAGFLFGTVRVLWLAPRVGAPAAVALELPLILLVSWIACGWCLDRFLPAARPGERMLMGGSAFAMLMAAELVLSTVFFGNSLATYFDALLSPEGLLGLAGQALFGAMPLIRALRPNRRD